MRIIPVIDLMSGLVVRGVGGKRHEYLPIESKIAADATPASVAAAYRGLGFCEAYVADLDAIAGQAPAWTAYKSLIESGLALWVDAGLRTVDQAQALADPAETRRPVEHTADERNHGPINGGLSRIIVGLETLPGPDAAAAMLHAVGPERFVFSLDLRDGSPLSASLAWRGMAAGCIANEILSLGAQRLIVLDLARVGTGGGVGVLELIRAIRCDWPEVEMISGGGVRNADDLRSLAAAGCDAALVASALHDGRLTAAEIGEFAALRSG